MGRLQPQSLQEWQKEETGRREEEGQKWVEEKLKDVIVILMQKVAVEVVVLHFNFTIAKRGGSLVKEAFFISDGVCRQYLLT